MDLAYRMLCADPYSKESFHWLWKALLSKLKTRNVTNKNYWIWVLKPCGTWLKYCQSNADNKSSSILRWAFTSELWFGFNIIKWFLVITARKSFLLWLLDSQIHFFLTFMWKLATLNMWLYIDETSMGIL